MKRILVLLLMSLINSSGVANSLIPVKTHFNVIQIPDRNAVDTMLKELMLAKSTDNHEVFIDSDGAPVQMKVIDFQIEYLERIKNLLSECKDRDIFGQRLIAAYPRLDGVSNVKPLAKALYPDDPVDVEKEAVRVLLYKYTKSVSDIDQSLARDVWAGADEISVINAAGQFFGFNSIFNDFIVKAFGKLSERKLSSVSEVIHVYGDMAYIEFYWTFDIKDETGKKGQRRGRETLICRKVDKEWKVYHIHYSGMPG